ncbi:MAG: hypothetical protein R3F62_30965 [Planctomycetota bacterium]
MGRPADDPRPRRSASARIVAGLLAHERARARGCPEETDPELDAAERAPVSATPAAPVRVALRSRRRR